MNQLINLLLELFVLMLALILLIPVIVFFVECILAVLPQRQKSKIAVELQPTVAVLVPAHNEATGIGMTLRTLLPQLKEHDRLIVIADNCSDETAEVARAMGASVIEREDTEKRGKGYALDFGLQLLASNPPDVVVMIDADCEVSAEAIARITGLAVAKQQPVQATYLLAQPTNPTPKDAVSVLAFTVKNLVRPLGLARLHLPCLLTGTGMAFPWTVIHPVSLASSNIVEDMQLSLDLLVAGHAAIFCAEAEVTGLLPRQQQAAKNQRTRWEHGHLKTLLSQVPRLLKAGINQRRLDLLAVAIDLSVPPLSLLMMLWMAVVAVAIAVSLLNHLYAPLLLLMLEGLLILLAVLAAWSKFARKHLPLSTLLSVPLYILWKIPLYLKFLSKPETTWIRTERDGNPEEPDLVDATEQFD